MSNLTRQEIVDAHEALRELFSKIPDGPGVFELGKTVLKAMPEVPPATMAEIEWDNDFHCLAEAENPTYGKVIMLYRPAGTSGVKVLVKDDNKGEVYERFILAKNLVPTGRLFMICEV